MHLNELLDFRASLYHGTSFRNAVLIIQDNMFRDKTEHTLPSIGLVTGVSFTRNRRFAENWSWMVFELDRDRLAQRYRLIPTNYWQHSTERTRSDVREEAEEFVIGNVTQADRYITALHITAKHLSYMERTNKPAEGFFDVVLKHPLLQVHGTLAKTAA